MVSMCHYFKKVQSSKEKEMELEAELNMYRLEKKSKSDERRSFYKKLNSTDVIINGNYNLNKVNSGSSSVDANVNAGAVIQLSEKDIVENDDTNVDELYLAENDNVVTHGDDDQTPIVPESEKTNKEGVDGEK